MLQCDAATIGFRQDLIGFVHACPKYLTRRYIIRTVSMQGWRMNSMRSSCTVWFQTALRVSSILLILQSLAIAQQSLVEQPPTNTSELNERIVGAALARGGSISFLETLTDTIGGRITGTPESQRAAELILKTLREAGFDNAHFEEFSYEIGWKPGSAAGLVASPVRQPLVIGTYGWAPGTNGRVTVPLASCTATAGGKCSENPAKLRGAAALVSIEVGANSFAANYVVLRAGIARYLASVGAAAMMIASDKPHRMLYTSGAGFYPRAPLPVLSVAKEDSLFLRRLLAKGDVKLELDVQNTFDPHPAHERNVVADLPGTNPDDVVLLGAHFDSWDPAQGAYDNGAGVAAVLDAARILKSLGVKPKATIRFVFFSGEEEACLGSRAYIDRHKNQLDHLWAALIMDDGAQMPTGFSLHGRNDLEAPLKHTLAALAPLGANNILPGGDLFSDDESFVVAGVPTMNLSMVEGDYDTHHHAITDTFDKVDPLALAMDTAVLAVAANAIASADQAPGRRLSHSEVVGLLRKTKQAEYVELDFGRLEP